MADDKRTTEEERDGPRSALARVVENVRHDATVEEVREGKYEQEASPGQGPVAARRAEQEAETDHAKAAPGPGVMTDAMFKGLLFGVVAGGIVGALLVSPVAFFLLQDLELWARLLLFGACGAIAGATAGAVYFGGRLPELEGEVVDADHRPSAGTTMRDPHTDPRGN